MDYDCTIVNSIAAVCDVYNVLFKNHKGFKPAVWQKCGDWGMKSVCPLTDNIDEMFSNKLFFDYVKFINANTKTIIGMLCEKYDITVVSIGNPANVAHKAIWLHRHLPCIKSYILITKAGCPADKSLIDMHDAIFIDDNTENLLSSNAVQKYIFGKEYEWNQGYDFPRLKDWSEVKKILL